MTRLYAQLEALESSGEQVSVAVLGVGRMGRSLAVTSQYVSGVEVTTLADIRTDRAREAAREMGYDDAAIAEVDGPDDGDAARESGHLVVADDALVPPQMDDVDVVIGATGHPDIGAQAAVRSILNGKHVVMLTDETDAAVGPYLGLLASQSGVVYSGAAGDEPGAVMELYDFARSLGFEIVAAGKGKNNPLDRTATPESLAAEAEQKDLNPEIYTAFVDGTNSMLEMTMVANAAGLGVDTRGLHGPEVGSVSELSDVFDTESGVLTNSGVVDYALGGGVAPGVFLVVTTDDQTVREDLEYLKMGSGPNYVLHRTYHIPTIEPLLTAARAELYDTANLIPQEPTVDTVTVAKRDLSAGEEVDGIGGSTVYGLAENADVAADENLVPVSLVAGATVERPVEQGEALTYGDVSLRQGELYHLRQLQDSHF
ncbi:NAD(P)-dependent oxidoreductase [Halobacteriales archaeon QS_4_69_31]|nr:MAG: NAD(P)-dependent oxidoreductase [Halobacteriales archaeon QS_4_69_31]